MSGKFEPVTLTWKGKSYLIPPDRILGAIMRIEDTLTITEMNGYFQRGGAPLGKLAKIYADILTYAGAPVSPDLDAEVYHSMFGQDGADQQGHAAAAIQTILAMMVPPEYLQGNPRQGAQRRAPASSSRKRTKR